MITHLDVIEGGVLTVGQRLYNHEGGHEVVGLDMMQHLSYEVLTLLHRGKVGESLHPQVGVLSTVQQN